MKKIAPAILGAARWLAIAAVAAFGISVPLAQAQIVPPQTAIQSVAGSNTITGTILNISSYADVQNVPLTLVPAANNTTAATLNLNSFGSSPQFRKATSAGLAALTGNELVAGVPALIMYDGTYFDILSASTATLPSLLPQGYLTPCQVSAGSPVSGCTAGQLLPTGDVTGTTSLFYEPAFGNGVPIYNGVNFVNVTFSELGLGIPSSRLANTLYDVYVILNSGSPTLCFGLAWTTSTAGSGNRGTGASTAQISQVAGIWTNAVSMSGCVNGSNTYSVPANEGTVIATVLISATNGEVTFNRTWGQGRQWDVSNFYNAQPLYLKAGDPTTTWNYNTATWRASNGNAANSLTTVTGLPLMTVSLSFYQLLQVEWTGTPALSFNGVIRVGIGVNVTNSPSGVQGVITDGITTGSNSSNFTFGTVPTAAYIDQPAIGANVFTSLENGVSATNVNLVFDGNGESNMVLYGSWRG